MYLHPDQVILIAGAHGMVGSALIRLLKQEGYHYLLTPSRNELDYTDQAAVQAYLQKHSPDVIVVAAAKVGGIYANMTYPAEFIYENLMIGANLIHEAYRNGVKRLLYLGSTCIYPREAPQPIPEEALLTGPLEKTNEAYALAKIAGIKLCHYYRKQYGCHFIAAMPTNLYGPGDNYHPENAHVLPALIRRFHEAKIARLPQVSVWGTGQVRREFLYVEDLAEACLFLLKYYDEAEHINISSDEEFTISEVAHEVARIVGYEGRLVQDLTKPDGTPRKKIDISHIVRLGWRPQTSLQEGLKMAYRDFLNSYGEQTEEKSKSLMLGAD